MQDTPGAKFRAALCAETPLQVVGAITAYAARMAQASGYLALYISGGGVAANSLGMPDLGISTMDDVLIDLRRITDATSLPVLVDIDTGWGGAGKSVFVPILRDALSGLLRMRPVINATSP